MHRKEVAWTLSCMLCSKTLTPLRVCSQQSWQLTKCAGSQVRVRDKEKQLLGVCTTGLNRTQCFQPKVRFWAIGAGGGGSHHLHKVMRDWTVMRLWKDGSRGRLKPSAKVEDTAGGLESWRYEVPNYLWLLALEKGSPQTVSSWSTSGEYRLISTDGSFCLPLHLFYQKIK